VITMSPGAGALLLLVSLSWACDQADEPVVRPKPKQLRQAAPPPALEHSLAAKVPLPNAPSARPAADGAMLERSEHGKFHLTFEPVDQCMVSFRRLGGELHRSFLVPDCVAGTPGLSQPEGVARAGELALPYRGDGNVEYHLFRIATARGGNAAPGSDYWMVVVSGADTWTKRLGGSETLVGAIQPGPPRVLVLEHVPTTTALGARYVVTPQKVTASIVPQLVSRVVSTKTRKLEGSLEAGSHADNFRPYLDVSGETVGIDEAGSCALPESPQGQKVKMSVEVTTFSDGRTSTKCLTLSPSGAAK